MEPSRDEVLLEALESLRPAPAQTFAAELDARAAAGFPRESATAPLGAALSRGLDRIRALRPRQLAFGGGTAALATVAIATVVVVGANSGSQLNVDTSSSAGGGESVAVPPAKELHFERTPSGINDYFKAAAEPPAVSSEGASSSKVPNVSSSAAGGSDGQVESASGEAVNRTTSLKAFDASGKYVQSHRDVQRSAQIVLGTEPDAVGDAAGKVLAAVHDSHGVVLISSVHNGTEGGAGAAFELLIPSGRLSDTLAAFSEIAEVRYRHEGTADITAPTESTRDLLQDSHARVESLLNELAGAETEIEREVAEAKLHGERRRAAALKSSLSRLERRADLSLVRLRIKTNDPPASSSSGGWNVGDAFHDAGQILAVAAGVAIVGLAVIGPIALIALLVWLANRAWVRQRRERALG